MIIFKTKDQNLLFMRGFDFHAILEDIWIMWLLNDPPPPSTYQYYSLRQMLTHGTYPINDV